MTLALLLQQVWFSALVGWSAGLFGQQRIVEQMQQANQILMKGLDSSG